MFNLIKIFEPNNWVFGTYSSYIYNIVINIVTLFSIRLPYKTEPKQSELNRTLPVVFEN